MSKENVYTQKQVDVLVGNYYSIGIDDMADKVFEALDGRIPSAELAQILEDCKKELQAV